MVPEQPQKPLGRDIQIQNLKYRPIPLITALCGSSLYSSSRVYSLFTCAHGWQIIDSSLQFATSCCNTSIATWSTPSESPDNKPFLEVYSCCGFWLWFWPAAVVVNLFVLNLVYFVGRAAITFLSPPHESSDLFIRLISCG